MQLGMAQEYFMHELLQHFQLVEYPKPTDESQQFASDTLENGTLANVNMGYGMLEIG